MQKIHNNNFAEVIVGGYCVSGGELLLVSKYFKRPSTNLHHPPLAEEAVEYLLLGLIILLSIWWIQRITIY